MELDKQLLTIRLLLTKGLPMTLLLAVLALVTAFVLGVLLGVIRSYKIPVVRVILDAWLAIIRGVPFLLLLLLIFFCTPIKDKYWASLVALTIYNSTYICEIIYGGIVGLGTGQIKAAYSMGMGVIQTIWYVILPQVLNLTMPALIGQLVILIKGTAACSRGDQDRICRHAGVWKSPHYLYLHFTFVLCDLPFSCPVCQKV